MQRRKQERASLVSVFSQTHPPYSKSPHSHKQGARIVKKLDSLPFSPMKFDSFPQELNINKPNKGIKKSQ